MKIINFNDKIINDVYRIVLSEIERNSNLFSETSAVDTLWTGYRWTADKFILFYAYNNTHNGSLI